VRPQPPDQDPTAPVRSNLSQPPPFAPAAAADRWIEIQWVSLGPTRVNSGQTGMTSSFCRNPPIFLILQKYSSAVASSFTIRSFCYV
jgi:hypothetical protein